MRTVRGDLLRLGKDGELDVIIHGCNCMCSMGKGIARSVKAQFPAAFAADRETKAGDRFKLGSVTVGEHARPDGSVLHVVNGYIHFHWKGPESRTDYDALREVFRQVKARFAGRKIGYPKIGAGLAGGDWSRITRIIDEELAGEDHVYVEYAP